MTVSDALSLLFAAVADKTYASAIFSCEPSRNQGNFSKLPKLTAAQ